MQLALLIENLLIRKSEKKTLEICALRLSTMRVFVQINWLVGSLFHS